MRVLAVNGYIKNLIDSTLETTFAIDLCPLCDAVGGFISLNQLLLVWETLTES